MQCGYQVLISSIKTVAQSYFYFVSICVGGHFQEYFSRIAKTNILANTHLIVEKPEGSKYAASVNWNIPAVSSEWLYECARSGHKVPETPYMLSLEKSSTEKGESQAERAQQEIETDEKEELEDNINNVFNDFSVPQNVKVERGGDIEQDQGTGNKSEAPANQKSKPGTISPVFKSMTSVYSGRINFKQ
jgi:topoisomerase (DNA) II binding protein 1